jgi:dihydroorotate dehydrogenase electron transfer subunit
MNKAEAVTKGIFQANVLSNQQIRQCYYRIILEFDPTGSELFRNVLPGQFLELDLSRISLPESTRIPEHLRNVSQRQVLLRRPFSFSDVMISRDKKETSVKVESLYCVLGPATVRMMSLKSDDTINVMGPLGNGFSIPDGLSQAILIAGGMGSPPILHLASYLKQHYPECRPVCFVGAKTCEDLPFTVRLGNQTGVVLEEFEIIRVPSFVATDDGSAGYRGFVTDNARHWIEKNPIDPAATAIFACGPEPMLASAALLAENYRLPCQVSMERMMACGIGLCQSCAVETKSDSGETKYRLCCKDGPVFNANEVIFHKA